MKLRTVQVEQDPLLGKSNIKQCQFTGGSASKITGSNFSYFRFFQE